MNLKWIKCGDDDHWCSFSDVNLDKVTAGGVYIIWHEGNPGRVVRIGQGDIKDRLGRHRKDSQITAYGALGKLRVTWASVPSSQRDGVETYLADQWNPLIGEAFPDALPIAVNSPW
jgi:hypothetical protein